MANDKLYFDMLDKVISEVLQKLSEHLVGLQEHPNIIFKHFRVTNKEHMAVLHIAKILQIYEYANVFVELKWYQRLYLHLKYGKKLFDLPKQLPSKNLVNIYTDAFVSNLMIEVENLIDFPTLLEEVYDNYYNPQTKVEITE